MAFDLYGTADSDPGEWFDFGKKAPFRIKVRRIPLDKSREIEKRHGGKETFEVVNGIRRKVRDMDSFMESLTETALWAWVDLEGFKVTPRDESAAKMVGGNIGEEVDITGTKLTLSVKKAIMDKIKPLATVDTKVEDKDGNETGETKEETVDLGSFIVRCVRDLNERQGALERDAESNS